MKTLLLGIAGAAVIVGTASAADAAQGCGPGWHRGWNGYCYPNRGPVVVEPRPVVVGVYYHGRGWWDGRRFWWHRERWHGGWRYR